MKRDNKGVSLIEILIAVVVFAICVTPIISQLAVGLRINKKAEDQQAATDYAKSIAETVKQMELQDVYSDEYLVQLASDLNMDTISGSSSFYSVKADGSTGFAIPSGSKLITAGGSYPSVTAMYQQVNAANKVSGASQEALVREYQFLGTAEINDREYQVQIDMDTLPYALNSLNNSSQPDLNAVNVGNLSSLDANTTAIVTDSSNYDTPVSVSFFNAVISALESTGDPNDAAYAVQLKNGNQVVQGRATKTITITIDPISADPNGNNYKVTCKLIYDNPAIITNYGVSADAAHIEYEVYNQSFKEMPDVYLMYNQFLYNKIYGDDVIQIENNVTTETPKIYVVRTADDSSGVTGILDPETGDTLLPDDLLPNDTTQVRDVISGGNFVYTTRFEVENKPVEIYTNIPLTRDVNGTLVSNISSGTGSDRSTKMSINVSNPTSVVKSLEEDERYAEQGRIYNIVITLTNTETGIVTTFDSSKGDY